MWILARRVYVWGTSSRQYCFPFGRNHSPSCRIRSKSSFCNICRIGRYLFRQSCRPFLVVGGQSLSAALSFPNRVRSVIAPCCCCSRHPALTDLTVPCLNELNLDCRDSRPLDAPPDGLGPKGARGLCCPRLPCLKIRLLPSARVPCGAPPSLSELPFARGSTPPPFPPRPCATLRARSNQKHEPKTHANIHTPTYTRQRRAEKRFKNAERLAQTTHRFPPPDRFFLHFLLKSTKKGAISAFSY